MPSVPDDHQHDYGNGAEISALRAAYPAWTIRYEAALHIYSAELRGENGSVHFLAGHDIPELRARLEVATAIEYKARRP
jgi:hypothetical protein